MTLPDIDALSTYGGALANYSPVVDPTTDEDASARNKYAANVAMMTHTAPRALASFLGHATTPADPASGFVHDAMWGNALGVKPTVVKAGTGIYDMTWPASVNDELGVAHALNLRRALAQVESSDGTFRDAQAKVTSANSVRVYTFAVTTLNDLAGQVVTVWVW